MMFTRIYDEWSEWKEKYALLPVEQNYENVRNIFWLEKVDCRYRWQRGFSTPDYKEWEYRGALLNPK